MTGLGRIDGPDYPSWSDQPWDGEPGDGGGDGLNAARGLVWASVVSAAFVAAWLIARWLG
jgi:hypothetical protein